MANEGESLPDSDKPAQEVFRKAMEGIEEGQEDQYEDVSKDLFPPEKPTPKEK